MTGRRLAPGKRRHELLFERRTYRTSPCRENVRDEHGRWTTCGQTRLVLAGETMGCCRDCFDKTRIPAPINLTRKQHADTESKT